MEAQVVAHGVLITAIQAWQGLRNNEPREIAAAGVDIEALKVRLTAQNTVLERLDAKFDKLIWHILSAVVAGLIATGGWVMVLLQHKL